MIRKKDDYFIISTDSTSYMMRVLPLGILEHVYYGKKIDSLLGIQYISEPFDINVGMGAYTDEEHDHYFYDKILFEYPTEAKGDGRESALSITYSGGLRTLSLVYEGHRIYKGKDDSFPSHALSGPSTETLEITLKDEVLPIYVKLNYTVYEKEDVILRSSRIINNTDGDIVLSKASSLSMDFPYDDFSLISFDGAWARERNENERTLLPGILKIDSKRGISSNEHSPLVFLKRELSGEVYGFNLIYSGSHMETIDVSPFGKTRIITGINDYAFSYTLGTGDCFSTPEAVMTYARSVEDASLSFHEFVNKYIIRGIWKYKERPVLINSWEASYFNYTEESLLSLAKSAASLGFELFVLDDGWFSSRRNDTSGLGDWRVNKTIFPEGLQGFSKKIKELGLEFGIWVEPEMINEDSELYRCHKDWAVRIPGRKASMGRHQMLLDLTRPEVRDYLYSSLEEVFSSASVSYVKWDFNRTITDYYSASLSTSEMGSFMHLYIIGLYSLLERLVKRFPDILFECCASGGARYDLGMLCFMSQVWTSDNTDLFHRLKIQEGTLRGFPPSTMGAHVSASPAHQSLRTSLIESRFNVAAFGCLGYELDLNKLSENDKKAIKAQIEFYKKYRKVFQYGAFRTLKSENRESLWWSVTLEKITIVMEYVIHNMPNMGRSDRLIVPFLDENKDYHIYSRKMIIPKEFFGDLYQGKEESEDYNVVVSGDILVRAGIALPAQFGGNGISETTRVIGDNGSRLYVIEEIR